MIFLFISHKLAGYIESSVDIHIRIEVIITMRIYTQHVHAQYRKTDHMYPVSDNPSIINIKFYKQQISDTHTVSLNCHTYQ